MGLEKLIELGLWGMEKGKVSEACEGLAGSVEL